MNNPEQPTKPCKKCGRPKGPGRCHPCRQAYLRAYGIAHRARREEQARARYQQNEDVRGTAKQRQYRWRAENRNRYLERKQMENWRRRARGKGITLEEYLAQKRKYTKQTGGSRSGLTGPS